MKLHLMQFYVQALELSGLVTVTVFVLTLIGYLVLTSEIMWIKYEQRARGREAA